jgi:hypothetical protein
MTIEELQAYKAKAARHRDNWKRRAWELRTTLENVLRSVDGAMSVEMRSRVRQLLDRDEESYKTYEDKND